MSEKIQVTLDDKVWEKLSTLMEQKYVFERADKVKRCVEFYLEQNAKAPGGMLTPRFSKIIA